MKKRSIILIGGGGHCKSCIDLILATEKFSICGIIDTKENVGQDILGIPIIGIDDDLESLSKKYDCFANTIGQVKSPELRIRIYNHLLELEVEMPTVIAPSAYISHSAKIGIGTFIFHNAVVNSEAEIGENCVINNCTLIEHEVIIEAHCHISTGAILNGNVFVQRGSFIGSNATIRQGVSIGKEAVVGSGSVVVKDVKPQTTVVGNPACEI